MSVSERLTYDKTKTFVAPATHGEEGNMNRAYIVAAGAALLAISVLTLSQQRGQPSIAMAVETMAQEHSHSPPAISPKPTYVGREVCRECHLENFQLHAAHGHAHTFTSATDPEIVNKFAGRTYHDERYGTYVYDANEQGLFARLPERFQDRPFPLEYALGSGHTGITLLSLLPELNTGPNKGTVGIEHRASWYRNGDRLGPTPGQARQEPAIPAEWFGEKHQDEVMHKCVYCHVTTGTIVDQKIVDLVPNVNCEKCHGPGSVHVQQARAMTTPPPFSVGRDQWDTEAEIQLCGDCHRLPASISRQKLRDYPAPLTRFQPVGLLRSECYLESDGQFKCTTCHNPHTSVAKVPKVHYVETCITCHPQNSETHVACPVSPDTGCIECHMPRIQIDEMGTKFHDHWIRVHDEGSTP